MKFCRAITNSKDVNYLGESIILPIEVQILCANFSKKWVINDFFIKVVAKSNMEDFPTDVTILTLFNVGFVFTFFDFCFVSSIS